MDRGKNSAKTEEDVAPKILEEDTQCFVDTVLSTENSFQRPKPLKQCISNITEQLLKRMN
jgi:hypothetical protein